MTTTMSPWARITVYWAGAVLFAAGFGMSAWALTMLMLLFGVPLPAALTLFAAADAGATVGLVMWVAGTGAVSEFGRRLARGLLLLSIIGNVVERILTFRPGPGNDAVARALGTIRALNHTVHPWDVTLATWFSFLVSVGIGITFPVLAYVMAHGVILVKQTQDAPPVPARRPVRQQDEEPSARRPAKRLVETPPAPEPPAPAPPPAPAEVADTTTDEKPSRTEQMTAWILDEWDAGRTVTGPDCDRHVGTDPRNNLGAKTLRKVREQHPGREPAGKPAGRPVTGSVPAVNGHPVPELVGTAAEW